MAVIALSTVAYLAALSYPLGHLDEGLYLFEAKRILHGDVFYRDIFDIATPGSYYLMALMFALFGTTMTVARTAAAVATQRPCPTTASRTTPTITQNRPAMISAKQFLLRAVK